VAAAAGLDVEDVQVSPAGTRTLVRVVVDADRGISLDDVAEASRAMSAALDDAERDGRPVTSTPYTLEVTSPGVDRPLVEPRHWRRAVGRLVAVRVGDRQATGRVVAADADGVTLELPSGPRTVPYADLGAGAVQVEFSRAVVDETDTEAGGPALPAGRRRGRS
jgi:ribosome maturation factor RimP